MRIDKMIKKTIQLLMAVLLLLSISCGTEESGVEQQTANYQDSSLTPAPAGESSRVEPADTDLDSEEDQFKPPKRAEIREVKFTTGAIAGQDLVVDPHLALPDPEVEFDYRWFVNDQEIKDIKGKELPADNFKAGDWIHCRVKAVKDNLESGTVKSKYIKVLGSAPILKLAPVESFSVPGSFFYRIEAYDPAVGENVETEENRMRYELLAPLDVGIELNAQTGEISWELDEETVARLGEKVDIKFKVTSAHNVAVTSSITLNFMQRKEDQQEQEL